MELGNKDKQGSRLEFSVMQLRYEVNSLILGEEK